MDNVIAIKSNGPHRVSEVVCVKCHYRWVAVRPDGCCLKHLECGGCHKTGYVIETGEVM